MKAQLTRRLEELRNELKTGRENQIDLEKQLGALKQKIVYISGAVKVLEEELERAESETETEIETS